MRWTISAIVLAAFLTMLGSCRKRAPPAPPLASRLNADASSSFGLGREATPDEISAWDTDVSPDGTGLPPGRGTAAEGEPIFAARCAGCHGRHGEGATAVPLVGGNEPVLGYRIGRPPAGSPRPSLLDFCPFATTLFDYIRRAMPSNAPGSLTDDETYSLVAWMLWQNKLWAKDTVLDRQTLPHVTMPAFARFDFKDTFPR